jgi:NTE family protein
MLTRRATAILIFLILAIPEVAFCQNKPLRLKLTYTTSQSGLKTAAVPTDRNVPRLGLALAGGGARAAASIGVLKVLAEEGIPVSAVSGTSMGAMIGGLYAAGYSPAEIENIFLANDWNDIFKDTPSRAFLTQEQKQAGSRHLLEFLYYRARFLPPMGLSAGQKLANLLTAKTLAASFEADLDFNRLKIPFRAVAADLETGEMVVLDHGLLHEAMRASSAIPLVFQPVEVQGRILIDGGTVNNLPVDVVKSMGSDVVIAVDASSKLEKKERLTSPLDIMSQSISIELQRETRRQAALADMVIAPDTSDYSFTDFPSMKEIINKGEEAARAALPRLRELMRPRAPARTDQGHFRITSLRIQGNVNVPDDAIRYAMATALPSREATTDDILKAMAEVFKLGYFSDISLELKKEEKGYHTVLFVVENPVVTAIDISGNSMIPTREIMTELAGQINRTLNISTLAASLDKMVGQYRKSGYVLVRVERVGMKPDGHTLEIVMYEGRVDSIQLSGEKKTQSSLIRREIKTTVGSPLNLDTIGRDIQHLYALDYFESLSVDLAKSPQGGIVLTFKIKEKPTVKVRLGLRFDLEDSFTGLTDIVIDNLTGRGFKLYLNARYGNYTDLTLGYHSPVFLRSYFVHTIETYYRQRNYFIYDNKNRVNEFNIARTGGDVAFGYQWFRFGDTYLRYRYETDKTSETLMPLSAERSLHIGSLAFLSTIDTRDSSTIAHKGILFKGSYESAQPAYGSTEKFTKTSVYLQGNLPLGERHTVMLESIAGIGNGDFPYQEKFGIGGADYLLGFPLVGYQRREFTGSNLLGFTAAYRWKIREYQLKVVKALYVGITGQAANVWDTREAMSTRDLRKGAGIGLYADTLIGPVRLDLAAGEERRRAVYFSAGFDF